LIDWKRQYAPCCSWIPAGVGGVENAASPGETAVTINVLVSLPGSEERACSQRRGGLKPKSPATSSCLLLGTTSRSHLGAAGRCSMPRRVDCSTGLWPTRVRHLVFAKLETATADARLCNRPILRAVASALLSANRRAGPVIGGTQRWWGIVEPRAAEVHGFLAAEDTCGPGLSYPRRMPDIPQLVAAIDDRLADLAAEINALDAARTELVAPRAGGPAAVVTRAIATRSRRRPARRRVTPLPQPPEPATRGKAPEPVQAAPDGGSAVTPRRSPRQRAVTRPRLGSGAIGPETLERLLADTPAGLSANAIAKQAGAGYARTLKLLHELEAAGQVRRSGARRSTVWQLITDEDRIAERAAELERLRSAPSRRRGPARTS
jgi:hypothetical protein